MDYQARLDAVNATPTERSILDSIDRPIRGLIQQMNAHGMKTMYSCCGFNYDGEEEPKSHSAEGPFVVFYGPIPGDVNSYAVFHGFAADAHRCGWRLDVYHADGFTLWTIRYEMHERSKNFYQQTPGLKGIHDYELPLIAIKRLENVLATRPGVRDYVIEDGNKTSTRLLGDEWQVKPKQDYIHKHETSVQDPVREPSVRDGDANV